MKLMSVTIVNLILLGFAGCQTSQEVVAVKESAVCPQCRTEITTTPIAGVTYEKHVCPDCEAVFADDAEWDYLTGTLETVRVCRRCEAVVEPCEQCAAKQKKK